MESSVASSSNVEAHSYPIRVPGEDFDQEGRRSTPKELRMMEGLFPLATVSDRLPFQESELLRFAKKGPFVSCFEHVQTGRGGMANGLLVNIKRLAERFQELAELANRPQRKA